MQTFINFLYEMVIINLVRFQESLGLGNLEIFRPLATYVQTLE